MLGVKNPFGLGLSSLCWCVAFDSQPWTSCKSCRLLFTLNSRKLNAAVMGACSCHLEEARQWFWCCSRHSLKSRSSQKGVHISAISSLHSVILVIRIWSGSGVGRDDLYNFWSVISGSWLGSKNSFRKTPSTTVLQSISWLCTSWQQNVVLGTRRGNWSLGNVWRFRYVSPTLNMSYNITRKMLVL